MLVEIGAGFDLDRATLVMLADAEIAERLIDVMVALSYPDEFTIDRWAGPQSMSSPDPRIVSYGYDPFSYRPYGFGPYYYYPWCLHRSLLIRQPVSEPTASSASTARLRQIPWAGRSRTRARRPQRYVA